MQETRVWFLGWEKEMAAHSKWQPTPVLLPEESHEWRGLVGYSSWDRKESDTTEWLQLSTTLASFGMSGIIIKI